MGKDESAGRTKHEELTSRHALVAKAGGHNKKTLYMSNTPLKKKDITKNKKGDG